MVHARPMRAVRLLAISLLSLLGCAPLQDASEPAEGELPCRTHEDCELASADTGPRAQICTTRGIYLQSSKDIAACGPMPNMTPRISEPVLACFRGVCVPVERR